MWRVRRWGEYTPTRTCSRQGLHAARLSGQTEAVGRIVDLFADVAASSEEGADGLVLSTDDWERLRAEWRDEDIEDILALVKDSIYQTELVDASDSLSARLVEVLGTFGNESAWKRTLEGGSTLTLETVNQLVRRVARLEEILESYRDGTPPDRRGFDELQRRLMDHGLEAETPPETNPNDDPEE